MELMSLAKEGMQTLAEHVASYRLGQTTLRYLDRALWTVEKCARWAVPPPLDQDERPQPELVRPLPWVFFLALLIALRVTRESISLINLVLGKPPLRSADVVTYIQSKRRYLRTLKYQGNRMMRARSEPAPREPWYTSFQTLFEFTMCFRRPAGRYGNNNTTHVSNNDEVLVVKRSKHGGHDVSPLPAPNETTMERLIEKIMVDLDADSDEDSSYTLTNVTSIRSDQSECNSESEQDTAVQVDSSTPNNSVGRDETPKENDSQETEPPTENNIASLTNDSSTEVIVTSTPEKDKPESGDTNNVSYTDEQPHARCEENGNASGKAASHDFIQNEKKSPNKNKETPKKQKIGNGRAMTSPLNKESIASGDGGY